MCVRAEWDGEGDGEEKRSGERDAARKSGWKGEGENGKKRERKTK